MNKRTQPVRLWTIIHNGDVQARRRAAFFLVDLNKGFERPALPLGKKVLIYMMALFYCRYW